MFMLALPTGDNAVSLGFVVSFSTRQRLKGEKVTKKLGAGGELDRCDYLRNIFSSSAPLLSLLSWKHWCKSSANCEDARQRPSASTLRPPPSQAGHDRSAGTVVRKATGTTNVKKTVSGRISHHRVSPGFQHL